MEFFDITDDNGIPTGGTVSRDEAHEKSIPHRTAHVWVVRKSDKGYDVLLQKRSADKESFPGMYDTSSAGHIQAGDEPLESAQRELEEELGIKASEEELAFAGTFHIQYEMEFHGKPFRDNEVAFVYVYQQPVDIEKLVLQEEEVESVKWFDIEEVHQCCIHRDKGEGDGDFCVPIEGLETLIGYLKERDGMQANSQLATAIARITEMETILNKSLVLLDSADTDPQPLLAYQLEIERLEQYYTSQDWKDDLALDEVGALPADLKRGVLSEDGIYDMLERNREYCANSRKE